MASALLAATTALKSRVATLWGERTTIRWPNVEFAVPDPAEPWLDVAVLWGDGSEVTMAPQFGNVVVGVLHLSVYVPRGTAEGALYELVDAARDLCNRAEFNGVRCGAPSGGAPPTTAFDNEAWWRVTVTVPFTVEEQVT